MAYRNDFHSLARARLPSGRHVRFDIVMRPETLENLRREAIRKDTSVSALIRTAVEANFGGDASTDQEAA